MRLFISKSIDEVEQLAELCRLYGIELIAESLIETTPLPFKINQNWKVIFFGSPRAAEYFFDAEKLPEGVEIACAGQRTAKYVMDRGYQPHFVSPKSGQPQQSADLFRAFVGDRDCFFPSSKISMQSYAKMLNEDQVIRQEIYETNYLQKSIEKCDLYVFTSPSNIKSFLMSNDKPANGQVIAWGDSTRKAIENAGVDVHKTLNESSIEKLVEYLLTLGLTLD